LIRRYHGRWHARVQSDAVEFIHELQTTWGDAYRYIKRVELPLGQPILILAHRLENKGARPLDTLQYNHNFFVIDERPVGPDCEVQLAFDPAPLREVRGPLTLGERTMRFERPLQEGECAAADLEGFGGGAADYAIRVFNRSAGAGALITGDRPLARLYFWATARTLCPEPYIHISIPPGGSAEWTLRYRFLVLAS
jgi:hypothetical protein